MDRTKEFQALVRSLGGGEGGLSPLAATALHGPLRSTSSGAFTRAAASASSELHLTAMKIAKLTTREYGHTDA
jgi:hypothetical protein